MPYSQLRREPLSRSQQSPAGHEESEPLHVCDTRTSCLQVLDCADHAVRSALGQPGARAETSQPGRAPAVLGSPRDRKSEPSPELPSKSSNGLRQPTPSSPQVSIRPNDRRETFTPAVFQEGDGSRRQPFDPARTGPQLAHLAGHEPHRDDPVLLRGVQQASARPLLGGSSSNATRSNLASAFRTCASSWIGRRR